MKTHPLLRFASGTLALFFAVAGLSGNANGQNLFRTGRPSYTKQPTTAPNWGAPNWQRPRVADQYAQSIGRDEAPRSLPYNAGRPVLDSDYQRMLTAWENYRREALRYQRRYGSAEFVNNVLAPQPRRSLSVNEGTFDQSLGLEERPSYSRGYAGDGARCRAIDRGDNRFGDQSPWERERYETPYESRQRQFDRERDYRTDARPGDPADFRPRLRPTATSAPYTELQPVNRPFSPPSFRSDNRDFGSSTTVTRPEQRLNQSMPTRPLDPALTAHLENRFRTALSN